MERRGSKVAMSTTPDVELHGTGVVVTGAASGIGRAVVETFVRRGADVVAADLRVDSIPGGCHPVKVDVTASADVRALMDDARDRLPRIDIVVNSAGIGSRTDIVGCSVDIWESVFAVNVRGVFLAMKHALPAMLDAGRGVIVNLGSVAGVMGSRDNAAYAASKGAVIALTRQAAMQYGKHGIRCVCVCPGPVDTPWLQRTLEGTGDAEGARARLAASLPIGRIASPEEIAESIVFVSSPHAAFWTGTTIMVDGGVSAGTAAGHSFGRPDDATR